jgi:methyl-accepting chemotaxis protein
LLEYVEKINHRNLEFGGNLMSSRRTPLLVQVMLAFGIPIFVFLTLLGYSLYVSADIVDRFYGLTTHTTARTIQMKTAQDEYHKSISDVRGLIAYGNVNFEKDAVEASKKSYEIVKNWIPATKKPEIKAEAEKLEQLLAGYTMMSDKLFKAKKENDPSLNKVIDDWTVIAERVDPQMEKMFQLQEESLNSNNKLVLEASQSQRNIIITVSLIIGILIVVLAGWYGRNLANRIRNLNSQLTEIGKLNLTQEDIFSVRNDEIGDMANTITGLKQELKMIVSQISESAGQVAAASEELTAISEQSAQTASLVANAITEVAQGAEQQQKSIEDATTTVEQVSTSIQQVTEHISTSESTSAKTAGAAKEGLDIVAVAVNQMGNIENTVNNSAAVVAKLGERSKEIGQIVDTISGIAGQTNLLALNAAIEAARAGEQGRGFAVVAEEVRRLAEQSQDAAKKIADLINEIQAETNAAVVAMNDGTKEVGVGTQVVNNAGESFQQIATLISELSTQSKEITAGVQQMGQGSQQLVSAIQVINAVSKNTAGQTQTVSASTEEQSASMEQIAASSQSLAKMAEELQLTVQKFNL